MHGIGFLQDLAIVMLVAGLVTLIFRRLRQPVVLGYILAGFIIGPNTPPFPLIKDEATIRTMADLGVVFLMFSLGLDFSFRKLKEIGASAFVVAAIEIMFMILVGYQIGYMLGWAPMDRIFLGIMLALTSTMIVVKGLRDSGMLKEPHGQLISGVSLFDDIFVIFLMILLPGFAKSGELPAGELVINLLKLFVFLVAAVILGLLIVPRLLRYVARLHSEEMLLIVVLALCFGVALLTVQLGFSAALGAFLIGAIMAESRDLGHITALTAPLRDMFCAVFFVAIGMLINVGHIVDYAAPVLIITVLYVVAKVASCSFGAFMVGYSGRVAMKVGTGMAQLGEFAFILATLGMALGVTADYLYPIVVAVASLNALIRPYLVENSDALAEWVGRMLPQPVKASLQLYSQWVSRLGSNRRRSPGMHHVRSLIWQLILNCAMIAALFVAAAFVARIVQVPLPGFVDRVGGLNTVCWMAAALLALPLYIATVRKMQAMAMMLGEISLSGSSATGNRAAIIRNIITYLILLAQVVGLALFTLLLSTPLLPSWHILIVLLAIITLITFLFGRVFNRWYSRAKFAVLETWTAPPAPPAPEVRPMPALLRDAELETVAVTDGPVAGKLIRELELRTKTGASIVALERGGRTVVNPSPDEELTLGDKLLLLGNSSQLIAAKELLSERRS